MPLKPNITLGESVLNGGLGPVAGDASSTMLMISSLSPSTTSAASPYDSASMIKASNSPASVFNSTNVKNSVRMDPLNRFGLRLSYLTQFIEKAGGRSAFMGLTVNDVSERFIKPMTLYHRSSFVEFMRINHDSNVATANLYVCHTWKDSFLELVDALFNRYIINHREIVIWMDLFCISQHNLHIEKPIEWWTTLHLPFIRQIGRTVLVLQPSDKPLCFQRIWCLFELYATLKGGGKVELAMTTIEEQRLLQHIVDGKEDFTNSLLSAVLIERGDSERPDEGQKMLEIIRNDTGYPGANHIITTELKKLLVQLIDLHVAKVTAPSSEKKSDENSLMHLFYMSGILNDAIGNYENAEKMFSSSMNQCKLVTKDDSPTHPTYLSCLARLSNVLRKRQKYDESATYYQITLTKHKQVYGENHIETLSVMSGFALLYENQQNYHEAETLGKQCYERQKKLLGENANETLITLNNLGFIYQKNPDQYEKAVQAHTIFYQQMKEKYTEQHPTTITAMHNLARSYYLAGDSQQAEYFYKKIYDVKVQVYGPKHPETLLAISNLALFYYEVGNYVDSNQRYRQVYHDFLQVFGENHPTTIIFLCNVGNLYNTCGEYTEAEKLFQLGYQKNKHLYGENHMNTIMCLTYLALVNENLQRYLQAEKFYKAAYDKRKEVFGEQHSETVAAKAKLEQFLHKQRGGDAKLSVEDQKEEKANI